MEKAKPSLPILGSGAYSLSDVSRYASLAPTTARHWLKGRSDSRCGAVLEPDSRTVEGDWVVSFLDLIDTYVVGRFRESGVRMSTVRLAYEILQSDLNTPHPFAHSRLYTDGKRVIVGAAARLSELSDELLYDAISKQMLFSQLHKGLERMDYSADTHLAARWRIATGVLIDPNISFGKPVVQGTGTQTFIVARHYRANGQDAALVGDLFGISETDVKNAVQFEAGIAQSLAA